MPQIPVGVANRILEVGSPVPLMSPEKTPQGLMGQAIEGLGASLSQLGNVIAATRTTVEHTQSRLEEEIGKRRVQDLAAGLLEKHRSSEFDPNKDGYKESIKEYDLGLDNIIKDMVYPSSKGLVSGYGTSQREKFGMQVNSLEIDRRSKAVVEMQSIGLSESYRNTRHNPERYLENEQYAYSLINSNDLDTPDIRLAKTVEMRKRMSQSYIDGFIERANNKSVYMNPQNEFDRETALGEVNAGRAIFDGRTPEGKRVLEVLGADDSRKEQEHYEKRAREVRNQIKGDIDYKENLIAKELQKKQEDEMDKIVLSFERARGNSVEEAAVRLRAMNSKILDLDQKNKLSKYQPVVSSLRDETVTARFYEMLVADVSHEDIKKYVQDAHYRKQSQGNISTTAYTGLIKQLDLSKSVSPEKKSMFTKQIDDVSKEIRAAYFSRGEGSPSWTYNERTGKREQVYDLGPAGNAAITDFRAAAMRKMLDGTLDKKFNEDKSVEYLRSLAFSGKPIEGYKPIKGGQSTLGVNDIGVLSEQLKTIGDTIKNNGSSLPIDEVRRLKSEFDRVNNQIKQIQQGTAIKEAVPKKDVKGRKFIPIEGEDE